MSNEVLPFISNEVVELFEEFDGDYLADVFRVWDCDAQDWLDGTTTVFCLLRACPMMIPRVADTHSTRCR